MKKLKVINKNSEEIREYEENKKNMEKTKEYCEWLIFKDKPKYEI
jgi:hypothetical protein